MNKRIAISIIIILLVVVVIGGLIWWQLGQKEKRKYTGPIEDVTLGLSWLHEAQFAGEYYADQYGIYQDYGLNVKMVPYDYSDLVEKLVLGEYEFAILQGDTLLKARAEEKPIVGLFVTYRESPTVYFSKNASGITKPTDFVGKKVGVAYSEKIPLLAMLKYVGVDESQVEIIDREYIYEPLLKDEYDVEAGWITDLDLVEKTGIENPNIIRATDYNANIYADIIATTEDMIKNRPDLVRRFIEATCEGWREAAKDIKASSQLALKYDSSLDGEHLEFVLELSMPLIKPTKGAKIGSFAYIEWRRMYEMLKSQGLLENEFDITKAYTTQFLK